MKEATCERLFFPRSGGVQTCHEPIAYDTRVGGVCREHVEWFDPPYMPRWWFFVSAMLAAFLLAGIPLGAILFFT